MKSLPGGGTAERRGRRPSWTIRLTCHTDPADRTGPIDFPQALHHAGGEDAADHTAGQANTAAQYLTKSCLTPPDRRFAAEVRPV
ncbi:hypothetical protein Ssi02_16750 [Sinosporangium siamense]|uniref:Uncharacterized protein n=1 Tax=Sinosporangium siamense TaxID=1367973 RepID=A0A919VAT9_9ACTN|nr:hypothetical protein Ssi02_16750 [Sinosporangium siamense]